jgi:hypothetical protein
MHITKQLAIFLDNRPGMLAARADGLAEAKINVEHARCVTPPDAQKGLLISRVRVAKKGR